MDLMQSVTEALRAAQHAEAQQQPDKVRVDGFVVELADDGSVDIRWAGEAVDPMVSSAGAYVLARYADTLRHAGIHATLVEGPGEPYLHCWPQ
jgi:hypothetical protein